MDGPGHLLSLKVMRVSRPALASAWEPFYSSSPSFSAHSTASIVSLQGKTPLPGHPKTLRDLTHATELLTLPSAFGAIQLGETFSSCLCVNNEANVDIESVTLKVDIQTVSTKVQLAEFGGPEYSLATGDTLENVVHYEIKELGQHVLACTVTYRLPPHARHAPGPGEDVSDPTLQTFRKFYKFAVTNPLSVKTKVHAPRSPSALLSKTEREKIFLEVHIQNLTQEPMWFERMRLEPVDGWTVEDENMQSTDSQKESIFSESAALMQPQDMRQYVYSMTPTSIPNFPVVHAPGSIIPLGRLDISWRSSFGEPGRLLTSMLSRRIPLPAPVQAASAVPPYLQRGATVTSGAPPRPGSPQHAPSRPATPPIRPNSPFRSRAGTPPTSSRPLSPGAASTSHPSAVTSQTALSSTPVRTPDLEVDLVVRHIPRDSIAVEKPFTISCTLNVSASIPVSRTHEKHHQRIVSFVVQYIQPQKVGRPASPKRPAHPETSSPRLPSGLTSASPTSTPWRGMFNYEKPPVASPQHHNQDILDGGRRSDEMSHSGNGAAVVLPSPFAEDTEDRKLAKSRGVLFLGSSAIFLEPIRLSAPASFEGTESEVDTISVEAAQDFELSYLPLVKGFSTVGGLRVILVEDRLEKEGTDGLSGTGRNDRRQVEAHILKEWDVIGEIWVKTK